MLPTAQPPDGRIQRAFQSLPLHQAMGLTLEALGPGFARVAMKPSDFTVGGVSGSVHGGLLAALVDITMLQAMNTVFASNDEPAGTVDLNITFMRPALGAVIHAEATVLRKGRNLAVIEVSIFDGEQSLCAKGRAIYAMRPLDR